MMSNPFEPGLLLRLGREGHSLRKVALLRASRIGDFVLATPAIRALRLALPRAEFTLIGLPFLRDLVARSPYLDRFAEFPGYPGIAEQFFDARKASRFFAAMHDERFDLAIQMNGSGVYSNPFALMIGARWTAGWVRAGDGAGRLDAALPVPEQGHEIDRVLSLPEFLGAPAQGRQAEFPLWDEDRDAAAQLLGAAARPLIGVHPGAREMTKRWLPERFARAAAALQRGYGGTIVIVGGPDEREIAAEVAAELAAVRCPALDLAGQTTLPALGAVIDQMLILLTNDSGPAHIAYALGAPAVTVFGSTDPRRWGPPDAPRFVALANPIPCWPCPHGVCPHGLECLSGITVEAVVEAAQRAIAAASASQTIAYRREEV